ncbi:MAG: dethiobiotin synthase [Akkermansiaceae bacterium]
MNFSDLKGVLVTGTDTHIGKTYVSALILEELRREGRQPLGLKPVSSGDREDAARLWEAAGRIRSMDEVNPISYRTPVAPYTAGQLEGPALQLEEMVRQIKEVSYGADFTLVEGAGGWTVPLGKLENGSIFTIADLAKELGFPVLVVAANWLGAINHTVLTTKAVQADCLECLGVVLNYPQAERDVAAVTNRAVLAEMLSVPILGEVMTDATEIDWQEG